MKANDLQLIQDYAPALDGVFTMPDLKVLFGSQSDAALYKKLAAFVREGILIKVKRGIYAVPSASLADISNRISTDSYISTGTVLARALAIGSIPERRVQAVKVGWPRKYTCELGTIEHLSIKPELYFGFKNENGVKYACPEKAFLDACYFRLKGRRLSFDLGEDINLDILDKMNLKRYLKAYDKTFVAHVRNTWGF